MRKPVNRNLLPHLFRSTAKIAARCAAGAMLITGYSASAAAGSAESPPKPFVENPLPVPSGWKRLLDSAPREPIVPEPKRTLHVSDKAPATGGDGTAENPYRTLTQALAEARTGDRISLAPGAYHERVSIPISGESEAPIIIEGSRGPGGEWLSYIDGSVRFEREWEPAPEIGDGVYKTTWEDFEPHMLTVGEDQRQIPRVCPRYVQDGTGLEKMGFPADKKWSTHYLKEEIYYWDIIEAMYAVSGKTLYLRFRDGDHPDSKILYAAPDGGVIDIENQSHIVIRDMLIRGGTSCVRISGNQAVGNIIEDNSLLNGRYRVFVENGPSRNIIRRNDVTARFLSDKYQPGTWGGTGEYARYERSVKEHFYYQYKYTFGPSSTGDYGVRLYRAGADNKVLGNHVYLGGQGITCSGINSARTERQEIAYNIVHGFSSIGIITTLSGVKDIEIHDNLMYDCNLNMRIHHVNELKQDPGRSLYVYRNFFYQKPGIGSQIYFHYLDTPIPDDYPHAEIYIYQNTFVGGGAALSISWLAEKYGGLPGMYVLNNIFALNISIAPTMKMIEQREMIGWVDNNLLSGGFKTEKHDITTAPWYGENNVHRSREAQFADPWEIPDFTPSPESPARGLALDISKPFSAGGKDFDPLPGMKPGYFKGDAPNAGAIQDD